MTPKFADLHHHLLYGMDDGPKDAEAMYSMLEAAAADHICQLTVTPHVTPGVIPFQTNRFAEAFEAAKRYCAQNNLPIELHPGCEILYTDHTCRLLQGGQIPTLGGTNRVLVEFSPDVSFERILQAASELLSSGYHPLLAHAERYLCLLRAPAKVKNLRTAGMAIQINARTVVHPHGLLQRLFLRKLFVNQWADVISSDAHNLEHRRVCMTEAWEQLRTKYPPAYIEKLMCRGL